MDKERNLNFLWNELGFLLIVKQYFDSFSKNPNSFRRCANFYRDLYFLLTDILVIRLARFFDGKNSNLSLLTLFPELKLQERVEFVEFQKKVSRVRHTYVAHLGLKKFEDNDFGALEKANLVKEFPKVIEFLFGVYSEVKNDGSAVCPEIISTSAVDVLDILSLGSGLLDRGESNALVKELILDIRVNSRKTQSSALSGES